MTRGIGPEQVTHERSEAEVLAAQTSGFWFKWSDSSEISSFSLSSMQEMSSLVREDFDLLSAEKVSKGLLFLMRCILNRKPSGLTFDHGIKRKKTRELRD